MTALFCTVEFPLENGHLPLEAHNYVSSWGECWSEGRVLGETVQTRALLTCFCHYSDLKVISSTFQALVMLSRAF
jgi:hypothetical protein